MKKLKLIDIDPGDIDDLLVKIENSFGIEIIEGELVNIANFGQLCDHIVGKINLENRQDCTSQQAFYKFREAICATTVQNNKSVSPSRSLAEIFPRKNRSLKIKSIEDYLGYRINILRPPEWVTGMLTIILLTSIVAICFNWKIGCLGLCVSYGGFWLANKLGIEFDVETVGELAKKMTRENYLNSRRNRETFNRNEIEQSLTDWFSSELNIGKSNLKRNATFV